MKYLRYRPKVDLSKCVGCHSCERRCPAEAMKVSLLEGQGEKVAPCEAACPAHIDVAGYIGLTGNRKFEEAYALILKDNPFPSVCGRICTHPCESKCNRGDKDKPIAVRDIKRFLADRVYANGGPQKLEPQKANGKSVGVVGAGPSGMTCAYYLALLGYEVHVYEEEAVAGGILAYGIPEYRLPKAVLQREIDHIIETGIQMHYGCSVGRDITMQQLREKHDAVYLATGTKFSRKMNIPGETLSGVCHGLDFLRNVNLNKEIKVGQKVIVVGGGNTAVDVARTAVRLGCQDVTIVYRRGRQDMPAERIELVEAQEEGVKIVELASPVKVLGTEHVEGIECQKMRISIKDTVGRRTVEPVEGEIFTLECDMLIPAVSQYFDLPLAEKNAFKMDRNGSFETDEDTMMTSQDGIFAGGDMTRGADVAIAAIADGKKSAIRIDQYLGGEGALYTGPEIKTPKLQHTDALYAAKRPNETYLSLEERKNSFKEAILCMEEDAVVAEAQRCLRCKSGYKAVCDAEECLDCGFCADFCPEKAITFVERDEPKLLKIEIPEEHKPLINEMCLKARIYPIMPICICNLTTAQEVCEAILQGYTTVESLIKRLGIATGCAKYCTTLSARILAANGYERKPMKDNKFYLDSFVAVQDIPEEVAKRYPQYDFEMEKTKWFREELFEDYHIWYEDGGK